MLKKRLVGVVTIKNDWVVQSFGYHRYLPLGKPECIVENLDRWGADEILVQVIDHSINHLGPDFDLIKRLGGLGIKTPLIYSGGIQTISDGVKVIQSGAERLVVDAILHHDLSIVRGLSNQLGAQAVIVCMPLVWREDQIEWFNYCDQSFAPISNNLIEIIETVVSEVLIVDCLNEGEPVRFEQKLVKYFPLQKVPLIAFGGLSEPRQMAQVLEFPNVAAVGVGNFLSYREHAIQKYKEALLGAPLRLSTYESGNSLLVDD